MAKISMHERASLLRNAVLSSSDGIITTFAVIAGAQGAQLSSSVVVILGLATLFADAISMTAGNYLGVKSEIEYEAHNRQKPLSEKRKEKRFYSALFYNELATFFPFVLAGAIILIPYLFNFTHQFAGSTILVSVSLFMMGVFRSYFTKQNALRSGLEAALVGGIAALVAYGLGFLVQAYVI